MAFTLLAWTCAAACDDDSATPPTPIPDAGPDGEPPPPPPPPPPDGGDGGDAGPFRPLLAVGGAHVCAVLESGEPRCWGSNGSGELGNPQVVTYPDGTFFFDGSDVSFPRPASIPSAAGLALGIADSYAAQSTCALAANGDVTCWGNDRTGALGRGPDSAKLSDRPHPEAAIVAGLPPSVAVATNGATSCAVSNAGAVHCWGSNEYCLLGNDAPGIVRSPVAVPLPAGRTATVVTLGSEHACTLLDDGTVACWGNATRPKEAGAVTPRVVAALTDVVEIGAGWQTTCARTRAGEVRCWGNNVYGQLGRPTPEVVDEVPAPAALPSGDRATALGVGYAHACASLESGSLHCWGSNQYGEIGTSPADTPSPGIPASVLPRRVEGLPHAPASISAGLEITCAVLTDHGVWCWGKNGNGALGQMSVDEEPHPAPLRVTF
ncbi:hypothetical protein LVJ94_34690 [Pendulispora rubella]|uniref:RCC1-like domain-containing protein n=1 Tax=Pendulispora rubella TaxID=2741070 RepID=A0ABZ2KTP6_9BACT